MQECLQKLAHSLLQRGEKIRKRKAVPATQMAESVSLLDQTQKVSFKHPAHHAHAAPCGGSSLTLDGTLPFVLASLAPLRVALWQEKQKSDPLDSLCSDIGPCVPELITPHLRVPELTVIVNAP